jgi:hypothetical protein
MTPLVSPSGKVPEARERAGLLRAMAAEDAAHPPGSFDAMPPATHAAEAIYQLRNVRTLFWVMNQPYPVMSPTEDGRDAITPVTGSSIWAMRLCPR